MSASNPYFAISRDRKVDYGKVLRYVDELEKFWDQDGNLLRAPFADYLTAEICWEISTAFTKEQRRRAAI